MKPKNDRNLKFIDGKWYVDFRFRGKRHRQFGGYTKEQARNTLAKVRAELLDVASGFKKAPVEDVLFESFGADFIERYSKPNKRSWDRDELSLDTLKRYFKGKMLSAITPETIEGFKAKRRTEVSDSTTNRELAFLKTLFTKAVEWGKLEKSPAARVKKFREPASRERILTVDEIRRLLDAASPEHRPVLIVALGTGMRRGEILSLKWTDLDLVRGIIYVRTSKSGKPRQVPMSGAVAAALGALPHRGEHVFHNPETGTHVLDVKTAFHAACGRAKKDPNDEKDPGITGVRFHDLRHTFASRALELGADIMTVSKILGHSSIIMTAKYLHTTGESMRLAVGKVGESLDQSGQKVDRVETQGPATHSAAYH
jgi:integrase